MLRGYNDRMFVTVEGIEGSGKSTQASRLAAALGPDVLLTQEPGGTALGKAIRELVLGHGHPGMQPEAEVLLFFADRAQHVGKAIRPALEDGRPVVSDRYLDSSLAYQGHGRGLSLDLLRSVARLATGGLQPDLTVLLDIPVELGMARVGKRGSHDRLESEARAFHERVRQGYLRLAAEAPSRWVVVDAEAEADVVTARMMAALEGRGLTVHGVR